MLLEVLGCHGGDAPNRRLPSFLLNGRLLLEAGSVTSALPLGAQTGIEHVLLSHAHLDHVVGLAFLADNVQATQAASGRSNPIISAALAPVVDDLRTHCFNSRLWPELPPPASPEVRAPR